MKHLSHALLAVAVALPLAGYLVLRPSYGTDYADAWCAWHSFNCEQGSAAAASASSEPVVTQGRDLALQDDASQTSPVKPSPGAMPHPEQSMQPQALVALAAEHASG